MKEEGILHKKIKILNWKVNVLYLLVGFLLFGVVLSVYAYGTGSVGTSTNPLNYVVTNSSGVQGIEGALGYNYTTGQYNFYDNVNSQLVGVDGVQACDYLIFKKNYGSYDRYFAKNCTTGLIDAVSLNYVDDILDILQGDIVFKGYIKFNKTFVVKSNTIIRGNATFYFEPTMQVINYAYIFINETVRNVIIRDITIESTYGSWNTWAVAILNKGTNVKIDSVTIRNVGSLVAGGDAIFNNHAHNVTVEDCIIENIDDTGILCGSFTSKCIVKDNYISNMTTGLDASNNAREVIFKNNIVEKTLVHGVRLTNTSNGDSAPHNVIVIGNIFINTSTNISASGNVISVLGYTPKNIKIENNIINGSGRNGIGISAVGADNILIGKNTITNCDSDGIYIIDFVGDLKIENNIIKNNGDGLNYYGIRVDNSSYIVVNDNTITDDEGKQYRGIAFVDSNGSIIDNEITTSGGECIIKSGTVNWITRGNRCKGEPYENSGSFTLTNQYAYIPHGLINKPTLVIFSLNSTQPQPCYVQPWTTNTFLLNCTNTPTEDVEVYWYAEYKP